jgi:hypothetical protein
MTTKVASICGTARCSPVALITVAQYLGRRRHWACVKPLLRRLNVPAFSFNLYRFRNLVGRFFYVQHLLTSMREQAAASNALPKKSV